MKKAFFFSLISFILLVYIFSAMVSKINAIEEQSKNYKETIKLSSYELIFSQLNKNNFKKFLEAPASYAIYSLANYTAKHPLKKAGLGGTDNFEPVFKSLFMEGKAEGQYFQDNRDMKYSEDEIKFATIKGIKEELGKTLKENGLILETFDVTINSIKETEDPFKLLAKGNFKIKVKDPSGKSTLEFDQSDFEMELSIEGMPDPMLNEYLMEYIWDKVPSDQPLPYRYIFKSEYNDAELPSIHLLYSNDKGGSKGGSLQNLNVYAAQGWFYGPMVKFEDRETIPEQKRGLYILVGTLNQVKDIGDFGAYLITNSVSTNDVGCSFDEEDEHDIFNRITLEGDCDTETGNPQTNKPFLAIENFDLDNFEDKINDLGGSEKLNFYNDENKLSILFIAENDPWDIIDDNPEDKLQEEQRIDIYGIEKLRDATSCGYYFSAYGSGIENEGDLGSPSFLQRLVYGREDLTDQKLGLFSFALGREYGGEIYPAHNDRSKLDFEFVKPIDGIRLKGMQACKSAEMCEMEPTATIINRFMISETNAANLNILGTACDPYSDWDSKTSKCEVEGGS